jgi:hypothetical protein
MNAFSVIAMYEALSPCNSSFCLSDSFVIEVSLVGESNRNFANPFRVPNIEISPELLRRRV